MTFFIFVRVPCRSFSSAVEYSCVGDETPRLVVNTSTRQKSIAQCVWTSSASKASSTPKSLIQPLVELSIQHALDSNLPKHNPFYTWRDSNESTGVWLSRHVHQDPLRAPSPKSCYLHLSTTRHSRRCLRRPILQRRTQKFRHARAFHLPVVGHYTLRCGTGAQGFMDQGQGTIGERCHHNLRPEDGCKMTEGADTQDDNCTVPFQPREE